jgi:hypothetical protein
MNETVKPNWMRANSSAVRPNMTVLFRLSYLGASDPLKEHFVLLQQQREACGT